MTTPRSGIEDVLPLSPLQEGLLFHAQLAAETAGRDVYTVSTVLTLTGTLDPEVAGQAAGALLKRHPNLRAGFRRTKIGDAVAVIPKPGAKPGPQA